MYIYVHLKRTWTKCKPRQHLPAERTPSERWWKTLRNSLLTLHFRSFLFIHHNNCSTNQRYISPL